jgi:hypothetical protein
VTFQVITSGRRTMSTLTFFSFSQSTVLHHIFRDFNCATLVVSVCRVVICDPAP